MKTISKVLTTALALGSALAIGGAASAQDWRGPGYGYGYGSGYGGYQRDPREQGQIDRYLVDSTCSGQRAYLLENRLRREVGSGQIDRRTASRIQRSIDDLQDHERHECRERDFASARDIGKSYIQIRAWIDRESGRYPAGGYWRR
ncbi:histidine kinase [Novosphingobium sp.]|uniref:histidine kinase n=1 Tax=Novosphingobium sp. TaxID=1874826 RepID=UPI0026231DC1|nr:histidine kinase [Novosphingobium sp.]